LRIATLSNPIAVLREEGFKDSVDCLIEALPYDTVNIAANVNGRQVEFENQVLITGCCRVLAYVEITEDVLECSSLRNVIVSAECIQKRRFTKPTWS
jgi:uncharacterized membrane-anchored protein